MRDGKKYVEAEPPAAPGYQGMMARKARMAVPDWPYLDRAREWIIQLDRALGKRGETRRMNTSPAEDAEVAIKQERTSSRSVSSAMKSLATRWSGGRGPARRVTCHHQATTGRRVRSILIDETGLDQALST